MLLLTIVVSACAAVSCAALLCWCQAQERIEARYQEAVTATDEEYLAAAERLGPAFLAEARLDVEQRREGGRP